MSIVRSEFVAALLAGDRAALDEALADEVVFNSPVRTYTNRDDVLHLLSTVATVLTGVRATRDWRGRRGGATVLVSEEPEGTLGGIVEERHGSDGRVREVTLMLRPIAVMMPTVKRMGAALEANPLPSADRGADRSISRAP